MKTIHFNADSPYTFSPIEYELTRYGKGGKEISNITNLIIMLSVLVNNYKSGGSGGKSEDKFWAQSMERLVNRAILLLLLAKQPVTFFTIRKVIVDSFTEEESSKYGDVWNTLLDTNTSDERKKEAYAQYQTWANSNFFLNAFDKANSRKDLSGEELFQMELVGDYFIKEFPKLSEKTKSIILETFHGVVEPFNYGILKSHFSEGVSEELLPENTYQKGTIINCGFSVKEFGLSAVLANGIMKHSFMTAMERRKINSEEDNGNPVFLWNDEYQNTCNPLYDPLFQATSRSSRVATVYITQTLNSIIGVMSSDNPENKAKSLIANLGLKVFCANSDYDTNEFAANMIGKHFIDKNSVSFDHQKNANHSYSQEYHYKISPDHFSLLKTGSPSNNYKVESILFKAGKQWSDGKNYLEGSFDQRD